MAKKRQERIPQQIADTIVFESDRTCCICKTPGKPFQLHHLDSNPGNSTPDNLVLLCLDHHHEASSKSTIGRGLSPGVIRRYRDEWYATLRKKRQASTAAHEGQDASFEDQLEVLACHEVRMIGSTAVGTDWRVAQDGLKKISPLANSWRYGNRFRKEVLDLLYSIVCRTRLGMPENVSSLLTHIALETLPIGSLVAPTKKKVSAVQKEHLRLGVAIAFALAHDGIKYLDNLRIAANGAELLSQVLRFAHLNGLDGTKKHCLDEFSRLLRTAADNTDKDFKVWIGYVRDDALALDGEVSNYPQTVMERLMKIPREFKLSS